MRTGRCSSMPHNAGECHDAAHFRQLAQCARELYRGGAPEEALCPKWGGEAKAWRERQRQWLQHKQWVKPDLDFAGFVAARDACRANKGTPGWRSPQWLLNNAFFCNTNRLWDAASLELQAFCSNCY